MLAGGHHERDAVAADALVDGDRLDGRLDGPQAGRVGHRVEALRLLTPGEPALQDGPLVVAARVAERRSQQEAVAALIARERQLLRYADLRAPGPVDAKGSS